MKDPICLYYFVTVTKNILFDQDDRVVKIMKIITLTVYIKLKNNIRKCDLKWQSRHCILFTGIMCLDILSK